MNYPTFQKVIDDLDKILSLRAVSVLKAKYETLSESYETNQGFANRWNPYAFDKFTMTWEDLGLSCEGTIQISLYLGTD